MDNAERIGNGITCRFWSDNWSPFGNIRKFLLDNRNSRFGIPLEATLILIEAGFNCRRRLVLLALAECELLSVGRKKLTIGNSNMLRLSP
ncbi:hypothetical protein EUTSA_v10009212mg [Eutrema salsugineum]|uniref:Uncharacterized protein n=1 Tax=Eutrema salsugineum TaxID=72664 RepID=V4KXN1_EUTSA|nr:hypothetical protein EUTSA_v10009212mg [Eutrema salsugineum]